MDSPGQVEVRPRWYHGRTPWQRPGFPRLIEINGNGGDPPS
jgi:hypothetical protein